MPESACSRVVSSVNGSVPSAPERISVPPGAGGSWHEGSRHVVLTIGSTCSENDSSGGGPLSSVGGVLVAGVVDEAPSSSSTSAASSSALAASAPPVVNAPGGSSSPAPSSAQPKIARNVARK